MHSDIADRGHRRTTSILASLALAGTLTTGCAAGATDQPTGEAGDTENVGVARQSVIGGWFTAGWGNYEDPVGLNLTLPAGQSCVLNGVTGNLDEGYYGDTQDRRAVAGVENSPERLAESTDAAAGYR